VVVKFHRRHLWPLLLQHRAHSHLPNCFTNMSSTSANSTNYQAELYRITERLRQAFIIWKDAGAPLDNDFVTKFCAEVVSNVSSMYLFLSDKLQADGTSIWRALIDTGMPYHTPRFFQAVHTIVYASFMQRGTLESLTTVEVEDGPRGPGERQSPEPGTYLPGEDQWWVGWCECSSSHSILLLTYSSYFWDGRPSPCTPTCSSSPPTAGIPPARAGLFNRGLGPSICCPASPPGQRSLPEHCPSGW
jgi:hypothetical protein